MNIKELGNHIRINGAHVCISGQLGHAYQDGNAIIILLDYDSTEMARTALQELCEHNEQERRCQNDF